MLRAEATHEPGYYDIVHSHYWLSGQVGWLARDRWGVPLVHTAHTLAAVKNAALADGDAPEPPLRAVGEQQVVAEADRLIVNTEHEAQQLVSLHHADPARIDVVHPGVDLEVFTPGDKRAARAALGLAADEQVVAFVGRIQPLKAPDVLLRAAAKLHRGFARCGCWWPAGRPAAGWQAPDALFGWPTNWVSPTGDVPAAAVTRPTGRRVPGRRPGRGAELLGILRPGRPRGPGLRHAGGGRRGRRAAGRGARRVSGTLVDGHDVERLGAGDRRTARSAGRRR